MINRYIVGSKLTILFTYLMTCLSGPIYADNILSIKVEGSSPSSSSEDFSGSLDIQDRSFGVNFDAFLKSNFYFGVSTLRVISGEGKACAQLTCFAVMLKGTAFGTVGYRKGRFTPFVGVYRYDYKANIELPTGVFTIVTENTDYRIGVWLDTDFGRYRIMASDLESDDASEVSLEVHYPISTKLSLLAGLFHLTGDANTNGLSLGVVRHF